jgi:hypothetical protein
VGVVIAIVLASGGTSFAEPVAQSAVSVANSVKQALKLGKAADRRSKTALATARAALPAAGKAADADRLDGKDSTAFLQDGSAFLPAGGKAADADRLDGKDSTAFLQDASAFLPADGKAADAETLDGMDSAAFVEGPAQMFAKAITSCALASCGNIVNLPGQYRIGTGCSATADVTYYNNSGANQRVWLDDGAVTVQNLSPQSSVWASASASKIVHFMARAGAKTVDVTVAMVKDSTDCSFLARSIVFSATG